MRVDSVEKKMSENHQPPGRCGTDVTISLTFQAVASHVHGRLFHMEM